MLVSGWHPPVGTEPLQAVGVTRPWGFLGLGPLQSLGTPPAVVAAAAGRARAVGGVSFGDSILVVPEGWQLGWPEWLGTEARQDVGTRHNRLREEGDLPLPGGQGCAGSTVPGTPLSLAGGHGGLLLRAEPRVDLVRRSGQAIGTGSKGEVVLAQGYLSCTDKRPFWQPCCRQRAEV
jgi:hypothetical protein